MNNNKDEEDIFDRQVSDESDTDTPDDEYVVELIVADKYFSSDKQRKYKVRWRGYGPSADTWEPEDNLTNCRQMLIDYKEAKKKRQLLKSSDDDFIDEEDGPKQPKLLEHKEKKKKRQIIKSSDEEEDELKPSRSSKHKVTREKSKNSNPKSPLSKRIKLEKNDNRAKKQNRDYETKKDDATNSKSTMNEQKKHVTPTTDFEKVAQTFALATDLREGSKIVSVAPPNVDIEQGTETISVASQIRHEETTEKISDEPNIDFEERAANIRRVFDEAAAQAERELKKQEGEENHEKEKEVATIQTDIIDDCGQEGSPHQQDHEMEEGELLDDEQHNLEEIRTSLPQQEKEKEPSKEREQLSQEKEKQPSATSELNGKDKQSVEKEEKEQQKMDVEKEHSLSQEVEERQQLEQTRPARAAKNAVAKKLTAQKEVVEKSERSRKQGKASAQGTSKTSNMEMAKRWGINLLTDEQMNNLSMEEEDSLDYEPMEPFDTTMTNFTPMEVKIISDGAESGFDRGWPLESVLGVSPEEEDGRRYGYVKFVGFKIPQRIPLELVKDRALDEYLQFSMWSLANETAAAGCGGNYWKYELRDPRRWMTDEALAALKLWREDKQVEQDQKRLLQFRNESMEMD